MTLTTDQTNAANTAITNIEAAQADFAALGDPNAKALYSAGTIFPIVTANLALCLELGNALAEEQQANAAAALAPFESDPILTQVVNALLAVRASVNKTHALAMNGSNPTVAVNSAALMLWIFQTVLAYVAAEAVAQAAVVTAAVAAATAAIGASSAQPVIVGAAVQAALASYGASSAEAAAVGAAVQAALA
jgi:hypothetical protein